MKYARLEKLVNPNFENIFSEDFLFNLDLVILAIYNDQKKS